MPTTSNLAPRRYCDGCGTPFRPGYIRRWPFCKSCIDTLRSRKLWPPSKYHACRGCGKVRQNPRPYCVDCRPQLRGYHAKTAAILERLLKGESILEIARAMGVSDVWVYNVRTRWREELDARGYDARKTSRAIRKIDDQ